ncbi:MAG: DegT/DnrJ/EryC1/StrS aminotransferase family protein [Planctomycetes bacterium]|nr:DegT/DnrJ/EryC1/StrS aminotransferase family protein [Planctomycetota bacterium]
MNKAEPIAHSRPFLGKEEKEACAKVIDRGYLAAGPENQAFAEELCERYSRKYALLTSSGATALHLAILSLNPNSDTKAHIPSYVCSALLNAVNQSKAQATIHDTPHKGFLLEPNLQKIAPKKGDIIIYPQLLGCRQKIQSVEGTHLIEDCAMSLGKDSLQQGELSIASFYATKLMTTGQGGAILTDRQDLYETIRDMMAYDNQEHYRVRYNYDLPDVSAAIGRVQLKKLDEFESQRIESISHYDELFSKKMPDLLAFKGGLVKAFPGQALFRYWVNVANIEQCMEHCAGEKIEVKRPVYKPLHRYFESNDALYPFASEAHGRMLSLPLYPGLSKEQRERVADAVCAMARAIAGH